MSVRNRECEEACERWGGSYRGVAEGEGVRRAGAKRGGGMRGGGARGHVGEGKERASVSASVSVSERSFGWHERGEGVWVSGGRGT